MKKKKKNRLSTLLFIFIFLSGLSLLLYPTFSDWWNRNHQSVAIAEYHEAVEGYSRAEKNAMLDAARSYNRKLYEMYRGAAISELDLQAEYPTLLNVYGNGMMGIVEIPSIDVRIPIYHGTADSVLQDSVGHIDTTSLPVGGENTHCILSGHTGLPSARLFTDLELVQVGDTFTVEVLGLVMHYVVDQIVVANPWESEYMEIVDGQDYCTLLTCTPYGVNSHRLLVRGVHVSDDYASERERPVETSPQEPDAEAREQAWWLRDKNLPIYVAVGSVVFLIVMLCLVSLLRRRKQKKQQDAQPEEPAPPTPQE